MRSTSTIQPQLLTERDAARWLSISQRSLWTLRNRGEIPFAKVGRQVRYHVEDLEAFVKKNKQGATDAE